METDCSDFEYWIRFELPKRLNLTESKQAAMKSVFYHFSDVVKPLHEKAPREFRIFFSNLQRLINRVELKRCPRGYYLNNGHYARKPKKIMK